MLTADKTRLKAATHQLSMTAVKMAMSAVNDGSCVTALTKCPEKPVFRMSLLQHSKLLKMKVCLHRATF